MLLAERADRNHIGTLRDCLPYPQLLEGPEIIGKSDTIPLAWAESVFSGESFDNYLARNELPALPADVSEFVEWHGRRRDALALRLALVLGRAARGHRVGNRSRGLSDQRRR
jgi:hypothetical protein